MAKGFKTGGRVKGSTNKLPSIKAAVQAAFEALQADGEGEPYHVITWAKNNPTEFYKMAMRLVPQEMTGTDGGPIEHSISILFRKPDA